MMHLESIYLKKDIPEDNLPYIWERFYKVDKSRKSGRSGAGLGMAIVREIFELHHYTYGIESQRDIGTRVWFTIPKQVT
ncbi:sensor histidine kinase [Clostridium sp. PL3]|uniref:histidine kinase n=1 Tax=Clostridium thailandense TaxID=2794346 RepID=A0A949TLB2_9CLOT|nr:HAMP domain-containing sensor histidine kinase [Clostridium thailandense]MBV7272567.1 sensor histidine kinase [Clostridium thailandense]